MVARRLRVGTASYDAATTTWAAAVVSAGGSVSDTQKARVDALIVALKAASLYSIMDAIWLFAGESDAKQATIDICASNRVAVPVSTPTLAAGGYTGNGSSSYINTNFTGFSNFTSNSSSFGVYRTGSGTGTNDNDSVMGMTDGTAFADMSLKHSGLGALSRCLRTGGNLVSAANTNRQGFYVAVSSDSNSQQLYKNGNTTAIASSGAQGAQVVPSRAFFVGARNDSGTAGEFCTDPIGMCFIGAGLTSGQQASLCTAVEAYMDAWSIGVI